MQILNIYLNLLIQYDIIGISETRIKQNLKIISIIYTAGGTMFAPPAKVIYLLFV